MFVDFATPLYTGCAGRGLQCCEVLLVFFGPVLVSLRREDRSSSAFVNKAWRAELHVFAKSCFDIGEVRKFLNLGFGAATNQGSRLCATRIFFSNSARVTLSCSGWSLELLVLKTTNSTIMSAFYTYPFLCSTCDVYLRRINSPFCPVFLSSLSLSSASHPASRLLPKISAAPLKTYLEIVELMMPQVSLQLVLSWRLPLVVLMTTDLNLTLLGLLIK